ncbi:DUF1304 family protein [Actinobacillus porcinus]|uniref:Predicted membrane protein n=1 Tax=Actinobacillus porcinus TaxID=51048 RepID=A0ABY6TGP8_9PAST|nr:DUF1304 family protein [Actinobacillus porcinus]VFY92093.1 Predicted membrane protein [Actinobacillus porcinus]VTU05756.1 Predicted membrane protein [Actinobacillus porcinus]
MSIFFLSCVIMAAVYGAISAKNKGILIKQGLPAMLALVANLLT